MTSTKRWDVLRPQLGERWIHTSAGRRDGNWGRVPVGSSITSEALLVSPAVGAKWEAIRATVS